MRKSNDRHVNIMIGYGNCSTVLKVEKGTKVMTRYGNMVEAGLTREEEQKRLEDKLDDICYSKPVAFVKKLQRKLKK